MHENTDEWRNKRASDMIAFFKLNGVDEGWFNNLTNNFPKWRRDNRTQQRIEAAKTRWKKEKLID